MQFVQQSAPSTISCVFDVDGAPEALDDPPTLTITKSDGTELVTDVATTEAEGGGYEYMLMPQYSAALDNLVCVWSGQYQAHAVEITTYVEIIGQMLFSVAAARKRRALEQSSGYSALDIRIAHDYALEALQDACGVSFVPRRQKAKVDGRGTERLILPSPKTRSVSWVEISGTALTVDELDDVRVYESGVLIRPTLWPAGYQNIEVDYVHGYAAPPEGISRAALLLATNWLVETGIPDRATVLSTEEGSFSLVTAGVRGARFSIPEVNAAVDQYSWTDIGVG